MSNKPQGSFPAHWLFLFVVSVGMAFWQAGEFDAERQTLPPSRRGEIIVAAHPLEPPPKFLDLGLYNYPKQAGMVLGITSSDLIVLQNNDEVYAVDRDGQTQWKYADPDTKQGGFWHESGIVQGDRIFAFCQKGKMHILRSAGEEERTVPVGPDVSPRVFLPNGNLLLERMPRSRQLTLTVLKPTGEQVGVEELGPIIDYRYYLGGGGHGPFYYATAAEPGVVNGKTLLTAIGANGKRQWQKTLPASATPSYVSPEGVFYHCCSPEFTATGPDGKRLWASTVPKEDGIVTVLCSEYILGQTQGELFFQRCTDLLALATKDGEVRTVAVPFKKAPYNSLPGRMMPDGTMVMMADYLYRIDSNGKPLWRFAPDLRGDFFHAELQPYAMATNGDVFVLSNLPEVYCITAEGRKRWVYRGKYIGGQLRVLSNMSGLLVIESGGGVGTFALQFAAHDEEVEAKR